MVCALVAEGMHTIRTGEIHHSVWTQVLAHQTDLDRLASAVMTCLELSLLRGIGYQVRIFDGSHQTPVIALNSALSSANPRVRAMTAQIVEETGAVDALRLLCHDTEGARIVGLPKADSSTEFRDKYKREYAFDLPPVTDRVLATEVLERGRYSSRASQRTGIGCTSSHGATPARTPSRNPTPELPSTSIKSRRS